MLKITAIIGLAILYMGFMGFGCVTVQPWERGSLAHHSMDTGSASAACSEDFIRHSFDVREGSTGGSGQAGGGCGCN